MKTAEQPNTVTDYLASIDKVDDRKALERVIDIALEVAPGAVQGASYGMPALLYRGKALVAAMQTKAHLALYPFSGSILPAFGDELNDFSHSVSALRFSADKPVPRELLRRILEMRTAQIDEQLDRAKK